MKLHHLLVALPALGWPLLAGLDQPVPSAVSGSIDPVGSLSLEAPWIGTRSEDSAVDDEIDPRDVVDQVKVPLAVAIQTAVAERGGVAIAGGLEAEVEEADDEGGQSTLEISWEIWVIVGEAMLEVEVDALSGEVLEVDEEEESPRWMREVLRHSELSLQAVVKRATGFVRGTPIGCQIEWENGGPVGEVVFANGRHLIEAGIEMRAGHLVELELEDVFEWAEGEEDEDEEEEDGDER